MIVPPYVPDAIQVPGNVAQERHPVRVEFIRRVVALHAVSSLAVAGMVASPMPALSLRASGIFLALTLVVLSVMRDLTKPRPIDQLYSLVFSPVMFVALAMTLKRLLEAGVPVWAVGVGLACVVGYTVFARRDFSFVGGYVLSVSGSSVAILLLEGSPWIGPFDLRTALALNAGILLYFVYDLAALQTRRRKGEIAAAVIDLYRDVLNIFSYSIRVFRHWREHKIWAEELGIKR